MELEFEKAASWPFKSEGGESLLLVGVCTVGFCFLLAVGKRFAETGGNILAGSVPIGRSLALTPRS